MKFGEPKQSLTAVALARPKIKILKILDGRQMQVLLFFLFFYVHLSDHIKIDLTWYWK